MRIMPWRPQSRRTHSRSTAIFARLARRCGIAALALVSACGVAAAQDLQPHVARYQVRLGPQGDGPPIGTAVQKLTRDCTAWHLERDVLADVMLLSSLRVQIESRLKGDETRGGSRFTYTLVRRRGEQRQDIAGTVERRRDNTATANVRYPTGPLVRDLPSGTQMPVSGLAQAVAWLKRGARSFTVTVFDAEMTGDAIAMEVRTAGAGEVRARSGPTAGMESAGQSWPVAASFIWSRYPQRAPLFTATMIMHESGAPDRLTINSPLLIATADLTAFQVLDPPPCPRADSPDPVRHAASN